VSVPDVIGMTQDAAGAAVRAAGLSVSVSLDQECEPEDPACDYRPGVVWAQTPLGGGQAETGSTVTIVVNP
jgi:beta-lactam-binding protein with PASTA domain